MRLSKEAIKEFKNIYYEEFRQRISDEEAQEMGADLLSLFKITYRPVSKIAGQDDNNKNLNDPERI